MADQTQPDDSRTVDIQTKVLLSTLDEISSRQDPNGSDLKEDCCVICLDSVSEPCIAEPCAHRNFDFLCLTSWLEEKALCPLCKSQVKEVRYDLDDALRPARWSTFRIPDSEQPESSAAATAQIPRPPLQRLPHPRRRRADRPRPQETPDEALSRRRQVYHKQLYSLHVGTNRYSRYQDLSPQLFESDAELASRARKWVRRELQVFEFLSTPETRDDPAARRRASNAEFLLEYVIAILKTVDIQGSCGQAEDMLQEFLGRENTRLFLHELRAWLRSPFASLEAWDRHVQYNESKMGSAASATRHDHGDASRERRLDPSRPAFRGSHWRPEDGRYSPYSRRHGETSDHQRKRSSRAQQPD